VKYFTLLFVIKLSWMEIVVKKAQNKLDWLRFVIVFSLLFIALVVTSCTSKEVTPTAEQSVVEVQATEDAAVVNEGDSAEAVVEETAVTQKPTDECLACHVDKEMLIATADPEEEVISENEGEG
jgi:hypothetical protein